MCEACGRAAEDWEGAGDAHGEDGALGAVLYLQYRRLAPAGHVARAESAPALRACLEGRIGRMLAGAYAGVEAAGREELVVWALLGPDEGESREPHAVQLEYDLDPDSPGGWGAARRAVFYAHPEGALPERFELPLGSYDVQAAVDLPLWEKQRGLTADGWWALLRAEVAAHAAPPAAGERAAGRGA